MEILATKNPVILTVVLFILIFEFIVVDSLLEKAPQIFIAHANEDKPQIRELYAKLKQAGYKPWFDQEDLLAGQNWRDEIPKALKNSDMFLACLSSTSISKQGYIQREFKMAMERLADCPPGTIYLIPIKLDDCQIPELRQSEYGLNLRDLQWIDYWKPNGFDKLIKAIESRFGSRYLNKALTLWKEKSSYLEIKKANVSSAVTKVEIEKHIDECQQEIQKLEKLISGSVTGVEIRDVFSYSMEKLYYLDFYLDYLEKIKNWQGLLSSLIKKGIEVVDWKVLHEKFQDLSFKLMTVRGLISGDDYNTMIHDLESHWRDECSSKLYQCTEFSRIIRSGKVRDEFEERDQDSHWSKRLKDLTKKINDIVDQCVEPEDLASRIELLRSHLSSLERTNSSILLYLNDHLKVEISEQEKDFEELRSGLFPSK